MKEIIKILVLLGGLFLLGCEKGGDPGGGADGEGKVAVSQYYPNSGKGGVIVTIEGTDWQKLRGLQIFFGAEEVQPFSLGKQQLLVKVPAGSGSVDISIRHNGTAYEVGTFTYQDLSIHRVEPQKATIGSQVRVRGTGLSGGDSLPKVFLNESEAKVITVTDTVLTVEVLEGGGSGPVTISASGIQAAGPDFQYIRLLDVKPLTGGGGSLVELKGEGFENPGMAVQVDFSYERTRSRGQIMEFSDERILVKAPANVTTGPVRILVGTMVMEGPIFTLVPPPRIESVSPESGMAGSEIVITGSSFSKEEGETKVFINNKEIVPSSITETTITVRITEDVTSGPIHIDVNGRKTEGPAFRYQKLGIQRLSPNNGLANSEILIEGMGFSSVPQENTVVFNGVTAEVITANENNLRVRVPKEATSGHVSISVQGMTSRSPEEFRYAGVTTIGRDMLKPSANSGSLTIDHEGNVYVLEVDHHRISKVTPDGNVSHFVGSLHAERGLRDGQGDRVLLSLSANAALGFEPVSKAVYLTDPANQTVRVIDLQGNTTTIPTAGQPLGNFVIMHNFVLPKGVLFGNSVNGKSDAYYINLSNRGGNVYGNFMMSAAYGHIRFGHDDLGNLYGPGINFALNESVITKFVNNGNLVFYYGGGRIADWAGNPKQTGYQDGIGDQALFNKITGITAENAHYLLVLDAGNHALRRVNMDNAAVTTVFKNEAGFVDGDFRQARISGTVTDIAVTADGTTAYIIDNGNRALRKVQLR